MNQEEFNQRVKEIHKRVLTKTTASEEENNYTESLFESIRHVNEYDQEFWYARELQSALGYTKWDNFKKVIIKAMEACKNSGNVVPNHFPEVGKMVNIGSGVERELEDYELSRYACYLTS